MSGWYAMDVDAGKSFVVVDIDDNDEQDAFWHMKPSLDFKNGKYIQKPFLQNFSFRLSTGIMTITTRKIKISWN